MFSINGVIEILSNFSNVAVVISIIISIIVALLGVIPSIFVTGANIVFFGPIKGFLISLIGETIGGLISFFLYRKGFKAFAEGFSEKNKYLEKIIHSKGRLCVYYIFISRLLPFIPSGFITLASAVSDVSILGFTVATCLGKIPSIALEALVSYDLINIQENWIRLIITILAIILIILSTKSKKMHNKSKFKEKY